MRYTKLGESLATYLYHEPDLCDLELQIDSLPDNANPAFRAAQPEMLLSILLGAHDEPASHIAGLLPLLEQRMQDENMPPTAVIVSCNAPDGQQNTTPYKDNIAAIRDFQAQTDTRKGLPVSYFEITYPPGTLQGKRRKDLGDIAMLHAWRTFSVRNTFPDKMSHMMLDVDTPMISTDSLARLHRSILRGQQVVAPRTAHHKDPAYPNVNRTLVVHDVLYNLMPSAAWDAYVMFDLKTLADGKGYAADKAMGEVHETTKRCLRDDQPYIYVDSRTRFVTSSRRIQEQLLAGKENIHACWSSFSETEAYRTTKAGQDISQEHMHKVIAEEIAFGATHGINAMANHRVHAGMPAPNAFKASLGTFASHLRVANVLFDLQQKGRSEYDAVQEAAEKYRIV